MTAEIWATVQQPNLFPSIYMMERFTRCDHVVIFDQAQFDRDNAQFKLMTSNGVELKTVELENAPHHALFDSRLLYRKEVWARKTKFAAQTIYGKSIHYRELKKWFETVVDAMACKENLTDFCKLSMEAPLRLMGVSTQFIVGSQLIPQRADNPVQCLVDYCRQLHVTDYVQGLKSMTSYFTKGPFEDANIRTWGQDFTASYKYQERERDGTFSILDLLFTSGVEAARICIDAGLGPGNVKKSMVLVER